MDTYWILAAIWSVFLACCAFKIHPVMQDQGKQEERQYYKTLPCSAKIQQWVLNFTGSMAGWIALRYFLLARVGAAFQFELSDPFILLVAFYGITGYLPYILIQKWCPRTLGGKG